MKRTTYFIDEVLDRDLKALAERQGRPVAGLVREAVAAYVAGEKLKAPAPLGFLSAGRSGCTDTAERHEDLLWTEAVRKPDAGGKPPGQAQATGRQRAKPPAPRAQRAKRGG